MVEIIFLKIENMEVNMENEFLNLFDKFSSHIELGMNRDIQAFLEGGEGIESFDIKADEEEIVCINIKLCHFSGAIAKKVFMEFVNFVGYNKVNLFICDSLPTKVKYLYLTALQDTVGIKMKVTIE